MASLSSRPAIPPLLRTAVGACALLSLQPAFAQAPAAPVAPATSSEAGAITAVVADAGSGRFLEGAEVSVGSLRATTARDGSFTLRGVPAGTQTLVVTYPGLDPQTVTVEVPAGGTASLPPVRLSSDVITLGEFRVTTAREGMAQAMALQKISVQYKLVAAADQFGEISEGNVGEYLKFLPGVSIDYNVNDARGVSLRGLSTAFTIVAVDGTPMAGGSSVDDTRRFEFEQIAMNNVETTELFKSVTPDIPATSTGGYVNFVTKSAFDHEDVQRITYNVSFSAPSTNVSLDKEGGVWGHEKEFLIRPSLEANYSRKLTEKLGINVNYRLSEKYDDSPRTEFAWVTTTPTSTSSTPMTNPRLNSYNIRTEQKLTHREAFAVKFDYLLSDRTKLMVGGQWNWYDLNFTQRGPSFVLGNTSTRIGETFTSGTTGASINNGVLYRNKYGTTYHFNGNLTHEFSPESRLSFTPYWSRADGQYRDTSKGFISSSSSITQNASRFTSLSLSNMTELGSMPQISILRGTTPVPLEYIRTLSNYTFSNGATGTGFQSRPWTAIDEKSGFRVDYTHELPALAVPTTFQVGVALDDTDRSIERPDYRGTIAATTGAALDALRDPLFDKDVAFGFGTYQVVDPFKVWETFQSVPMTLNVLDTRHFDEKNTAGYLRADVQLRPDLLLVGGVRWEKREIDATGRTGNPARARTTVSTIDFDSFYPSITAKYTPLRNLVVRGGFSQTIGIPDYGELLPTFLAASTPTSSDGTISIPEGDLKPYRTNNFDVSLDYYLKNSGVLTVSAFQKDVSDYILGRAMTTAERDAVLTEYGLNLADFGTTSGTIRENGPFTRLRGIEVSYAQNLTFLPKPFDGLNLQANYTYVSISARSPDAVRENDALLAQSRGVSPETFNLVLGYRYRNVSATLTNNWVSESVFGGFVNTGYITGTANANPALDTRFVLFRDEKLTTDLKVEYSFSKAVSAYVLVRNVFNSPRKDYARGYLPENSSVVLPWRYYEFGEPHLTLGVRGTF